MKKSINEIIIEYFERMQSNDTRVDYVLMDLHDVLEIFWYYSETVYCDGFKASHYFICTVDYWGEIHTVRCFSDKKKAEKAYRALIS